MLLEGYTTSPTLHIAFFKFFFFWGGNALGFGLGFFFRFLLLLEISFKMRCSILGNSAGKAFKNTYKAYK